MDVEMSASGAHRMIGEVKEEVQELSDSVWEPQQPGGDDAGGRYCVVSVEDLHAGETQQSCQQISYGSSSTFWSAGSMTRLISSRICRLVWRVQRRGFLSWRCCPQ
jgi:hypothetical protein